MLYHFNDNQIIDKFNIQPVDYWLNSYGGCRTNYIENSLSEKYKIKNQIYLDKGCHYIKPLKVNVKAGIFCFIDDVGIALTSQIQRGFYHNYLKARQVIDKEDVTIENWLELIDKQIDYWTTNLPIDVYIINTDHIHETKEQFFNIFGVELKDFKQRETCEYHPTLKNHINMILKINNKQQQLPKFQLISKSMESNK